MKLTKILTELKGLTKMNYSIPSKKHCYFCTKTHSLVKYTDGKKNVYVCPLCGEYAHRRAYKRIY